MAYPTGENMEENYADRLGKNQQPTFQTREKCPGFKVKNCGVGDRSLRRSDVSYRRTSIEVDSGHRSNEKNNDRGVSKEGIVQSD